jgi:hypothetical protein
VTRAIGIAMPAFAEDPGSAGDRLALGASRERIPASG